MPMRPLIILCQASQNVSSGIKFATVKKSQLVRDWSASRFGALKALPPKISLLVPRQLNIHRHPMKKEVDHQPLQSADGETLRWLKMTELLNLEVVRHSNSFTFNARFIHYYFYKVNSAIF